MLPVGDGWPRRKLGGVTAGDGVTAAQLTSKRLVLEPLRVEHVDGLAPVLNDPALHGFIGGVPMAASQLRARFGHQVRGRSPDGRERWLNWAVRELTAVKAVGTVQATVTGHQPHHASMAVARSIGLGPTEVIVDGGRRWELSA